MGKLANIRSRCTNRRSNLGTKRTRKCVEPRKFFRKFAPATCAIHWRFFRTPRRYLRPRKNNPAKCNGTNNRGIARSPILLSRSHASDPMDAATVDLFRQLRDLDISHPSLYAPATRYQGNQNRGGNRKWKTRNKTGSHLSG